MLTTLRAWGTTGRTGWRHWRGVALVTLLVASAVGATPSRIKDVALVNGLGRHKLLGYGLVAGLEGTGDSDSSLLTARSIANMLETFGVTVSRDDLTAKNMAAVLVTAELPAVVTVGSTLDVTVSSMADAKSLQGGTLLLTPLRAADAEIYAIAQGPITIGGFGVESKGGNSSQKNHLTVARVPNGGSVVKPLSADLANGGTISISLLQPDFTTAVRIAEAINQKHNSALAAALDNTTVQVKIPPAQAGDLPSFIVSIENLPVEPDAAARVVINERTGTVVIGQYVRIDPIAICHGGLTVQVKSHMEVSQPPALVTESRTVTVGATAPAATDGTASGMDASKEAPAVKEVPPGPTGGVAGPGSGPGQHGASLTGGRTVVTRQEDVKVAEEGGQLVAIPAQATLQDLVTALNTLGVKPRDLIAIIQALKEAHALQAELVLF